MEIKNKYNIGDMFLPLKPKEWDRGYEKFEVHAIQYDKNGQITYISYSDDVSKDDMTLSESQLNNHFIKVETNKEETSKTRLSEISNQPKIYIYECKSDIKDLIKDTWWKNAACSGQVYIRECFSTCFPLDFFAVSLVLKYKAVEQSLILAINIEYQNKLMFSLYAVQQYASYPQDDDSIKDYEEILYKILHKIVPILNTTVCNKPWYHPFQTSKDWMNYHIYFIESVLDKNRYHPLFYKIIDDRAMDTLAEKWPEWPQPHKEDED